MGSLHDGSSLADSCTMSRYGCCRDGITAARGPNFSGCPYEVRPEEEPNPDELEQEVRPGPEETESGSCLYREWGCCSDGRTPARGPDKIGQQTT